MSLSGAGDWIFLQTAQVIVSAATVGIHRSRWSSVTSAKAFREAFKEMKEQRFDVLPIDPAQPLPVTEFFATKECGKWEDENAIERREIRHSERA
jgi:hypothetical protein